MEKYLFDAINKHFKTLSKLGRSYDKDKYNLFLISTIYSIYKVFKKQFDKEDVEILNRYIQCLAKNNCLTGKNIPYLTYESDGVDSLVTIIDSDVISTQNGNVLVSTQRVTQNFTNFEVRTDLQDDNYVVGYDASDSKEVAINVNDLGVFWE